MTKFGNSDSPRDDSNSQFSDKDMRAIENIQALSDFNFKQACQIYRENQELELLRSEVNEYLEPQSCTLSDTQLKDLAIRITNAFESVLSKILIEASTEEQPLIALINALDINLFSDVAAQDHNDIDEVQLSVKYNPARVLADLIQSDLA